MCLWAALKGTLRQKCTAIRYGYVGLIAYFCHDVLSKHFRESSLMFLLWFSTQSLTTVTHFFSESFSFWKNWNRSLWLCENRLIKTIDREEWIAHSIVAFFIDLDITLLMWELIVLLCLGASVWASKYFSVNCTMCDCR